MHVLVCIGKYGVNISMYGNVLVFMGLYGYVWLDMAMYGYICMGIYCTVLYWTVMSICKYVIISVYYY